MPETKPIRLVDASYGRLLRASAKEVGIGWQETAELAGISHVTAWRVENGEGSVKAASALRAVLVGRGADIPPPTVSAPSAPLARWMDAGRKLQDLSPEQFARAITQVEDLVDAEQRVRDGMSLISHPLPRK